MMPAKPTGIVRRASETISTEAKRYSVQDEMKAKMATLAMPGAISGIRMRRRMVVVGAPSMTAASSISFGTEARKERIIQIEKGRAKATLTMTRLIRLSIRPALENR